MYLDLHGNTLTGPQPAELANLPRLLFLDLTYNQLAGYNFVTGQPKDPWQGWGQLTAITGHGRIASPNAVHFKLDTFTKGGRIGTALTGAHGRDYGLVYQNGIVNGTTPGIGGVPPADDIINSYPD